MRDGISSSHPSARREIPRAVRAILLAIKFAIVACGALSYLVAFGVGFVYMSSDSYANRVGVFYHLNIL